MVSPSVYLEIQDSNLADRAHALKLLSNPLQLQLSFLCPAEFKVTV